MSTSPIVLGSVVPSETSAPRTSTAALPMKSTHARTDMVAGPLHSEPTLHALSQQANRREALVAALLARVPSADRSAARTAIPAIIQAARSSGCTDPNQIAYFLATAQTESDFGANMVEGGHPKAWFNRNYGSTDGNRPGTDDGFAYRGRGYVQTTHAGRYAELSHRLGLADVPVHAAGERGGAAAGRPKLQAALLADPAKLTEPTLAAKALVVGVKENLFTHNPRAALERTVPAGREPGRVDFYHARGIVNGIVPAQAEAIARHATAYADILHAYRHSALGVTEAK